jgi:signal transduction histidine kinase
VTGGRAKGIIELLQRQRSATDLLTHYFEVNFDEVAEELAATGPGPDRPGTEARVGRRQVAAAHLREFIRGLIRLRAGQHGIEAAHALVEDLTDLVQPQRTKLHDLVRAVIKRAESNQAPAAVSQPVTASVGPVKAMQPRDALSSAAPEVAAVRLRVSRTAVNTVLVPLAAKGLERLGADFCQIYIEDDKALTLRAESRAEGGATTGTVTLSREGGLLAEVGSLNRAVALTDLGQLTGTDAPWRSRGIQRLAAVAVGTAGETDNGILIAARRSTRAFSERELNEMDRLAIEVSSAMASADLLSRAEELAVLTERMRLAREIHDGLASDLSAVVALFKYHDHRRKSDPADAERLLHQMRDLVEGALQSARDILATLRPRQLPPVNLVESVRRQVEDFSSTYGVTAAAVIEGDGADLAGEERDAFYQILKESLSNVRKHSEATAVEVRLDLRRRPYTLQVEDDGVGVSPGALEEKLGSFGLMGMRERAELLGGWIEIGNGAMGGARVTFRGSHAPLGSR